MPKNKPNLAVNVTPEPARPTSTTNIKGSQSVPIGRSNKPVPQVVVSVTTQGEDRRGAAAAYLLYVSHSCNIAIMLCLASLASCVFSTMCYVITGTEQTVVLSNTRIS